MFYFDFQVKAFGGFSANYGMVTAVIAFMLSMISISGMIWPEVINKTCYKIDHCYTYNDASGVNQTLCLRDKLDTALFSDGTLSLNLTLYETS